MNILTKADRVLGVSEGRKGFLGGSGVVCCVVLCCAAVVAGSNWVEK